MVLDQDSRASSQPLDPKCYERNWRLLWWMDQDRGVNSEKPFKMGKNKGQRLTRVDPRTVEIQHEGYHYTLPL